MELRPGGGDGEQTSHRHAVDRRREAVREKDEDRGTPERGQRRLP